MTPGNVVRPATDLRSRQYRARVDVWPPERRTGDEHPEPAASLTPVTPSPGRDQTALPPRTPLEMCRTRLMRLRAAGCGVVAEGRRAVHWKGGAGWQGPAPCREPAVRSRAVTDAGVRRAAVPTWWKGMWPVAALVRTGAGTAVQGRAPGQWWPEPLREAGPEGRLLLGGRYRAPHAELGTAFPSGTSGASKRPKPPRRPADGSGGRRPPTCFPPPAPWPDPGPDTAGGRELGTHRPPGPARPPARPPARHEG